MRSTTQTLSALRVRRTFAPNHKSGFTLIELLVVIAIIALLAAILFPVFGRARENARRSSCVSNLKQMGLAVMQYSQDYDEAMLPGRIPTNFYAAGNPSTDLYFHWGHLLSPYTKTEQIYACPSNTKRMGYTMNLYATGNPYKNLASVALTSSLVLFTDGIGQANLTDDQAQIFFYTWTGTTFAPTFGRVIQEGGPALAGGACRIGGLPNGGRHMEGASYIFADGHAKWLKSTLAPVASGIDGGCTSSLPAEIMNGGVVMAPHREGVIYNPTATTPGDTVYR